MNIKDNYIINFFRKIKYHWYPKVGSIGSILEKLNQAESVKFIEIGASQTDRDDHIAKYLNESHWSGVLVEPQKRVFARLEKIYGQNKRLKLVNAAISETEESRKLYKFNFSEDSWVSCLSSFSKKQVIKHYEHGWLKSRALEHGYNLSEDLNDLVDYEVVNCMSFQSMIRDNQIRHVDLLIIDTEGYDYEILKMIDFKIFKPPVLIFEHRHLSQKNFKSALKLLKREKYKLFIEGGDTLAHLPNC